MIRSVRLERKLRQLTGGELEGRNRWMAMLGRGRQSCREDDFSIPARRDFDEIRFVLRQAGEILDRGTHSNALSGLESTNRWKGVRLKKGFADVELTA